MHNRALSLSLIAVVLLVAPEASLFSRPLQSKTGYITFEEARPIIDAMREVLPVDLRSKSTSEIAAIWSNWVVRRDADIRARLIQGDEDSIVNFLLFGTSFTRKPRITLSSLSQFAEKFSKSASNPETTLFVESIQARADDLIRALTLHGPNERILFARRVIESKGLDPKTTDGRTKIKDYLFNSLVRVVNEQAGYAKVLQSAQLLQDPSAEFAERTKLFTNRGLSSDTSLLPNFAIERALVTMKAQGKLAAGSVRRVGIIGPGLDFTDKQDGYDFYPQQTIQPFAIIDTLLRLGLAHTSDLKVTTFDLSPRVNDHIRQARARAKSGTGYVVQLPRDEQVQWKPPAVDYWTRFGEKIGLPVTPVRVPPGAGEVKVRAVRIRPVIISDVTPQDVNIVLQRMDQPRGQKFDLIIATNILVYYDVFEQSLALANIEYMLRPGGFLLSNNALLELPGSRMRSVGYETVEYSDKPNDGDHIVWYQRAPDR